MEVWKDIVGFEGLYQVSNMGRVKSLKYWSNIYKKYYEREKILKQATHPKGYKIVGLHINGKNITKKVHRLVAEAFIPNPNNLPEVNHKQGIKSDNRATELEWATASENVQHAYDAGLKKTKKVIQYDLNGNKIKEYKSSREAERATKIDHSNILNCCNGVYKQCNGYIWRYKDIS